MSKKMPGVMIFFDIRPTLSLLSTSEKGLMLDAILDYAEDGLEPEFTDHSLEILWSVLKQKIDADRQRYADKCEQARKSALKRWGSDSCERIPSYADDANYNYNSNDNSNYNSNDNSNYNSNDNSTAKTTPSPAATATGSAREEETVENPVENPENVDKLSTNCAKPQSESYEEEFEQRRRDMLLLLDEERARRKKQGERRLM